MTIKELAKACADYFKSVMQDEGFDTFEEMKDCYWWDTNDIKNEVESVIKDYDWFLTDDRTEVMNISCELYSYRSFIAMVYKMIKEGTK